MLQSIRDKATGVFAWVIVILLIIPFALWGIQEYLGGGSAVNVATVNDREISRNELNAQMDRELQGNKNRPEGAALVAFRRNTLEQMIQEEIMYQSALDRGLRIHETGIVEMIKANPAFHVDGKFDQQRYEDLLRNNGLDPSTYQASLGRDLLIQQFVGSIQKSSFVTNTEIDQLLELQGRKLDLAYMTLPFSQYKQALQVTDEQIKEYFEKHQQNFVTAEKVKLDYLMLGITDIARDLKFTQEQLQQYYDDNKDSFITHEQRHVAHILIEITDADKPENVSAAEKRAKEVYAKLQSGSDFAKLAAEYSDDAGSSNQGGDIGILEPGVLDKAFEDVAVKLSTGEYGEPVKSAFGFHIIKVLDIKAGSNKSFADAKADVEKMFARKQADDLFLDRKEALYNLTYENPENLDVAAQELGLKIRSSEWFGRSGGKGDDISADPKVIEATFSDDVFAQGEPARSLNSKLIELKPKEGDQSSRVVVVRLSAYEASKPQALATVKEEIQATLLNKQGSEAMDADIEKYLKALREGADIEKVSQENSLEYKAAGWLGRAEKDYDPSLLNAAFKAARPDKDNISYTSAKTRQGDGLLIAIKGSKKGEVKKDDPMRNFMGQFMQRTQSNSELAAFVAELREEADITIFESRMTNDDS